jgi:Phosphate-selective porin O and P
VEDDQPIPHFPVFGRARKGLGAWELKFRCSTLHVSDGTESNQVDTFTPGLNWYLTHFVRIMLDLNVEQLRKPVVLPAPRQPGTLLCALVTAQSQF